jgi:hypothetical protein
MIVRQSSIEDFADRSPPATPAASESSAIRFICMCDSQWPSLEKLILLRRGTLTIPGCSTARSTENDCFELTFARLPNADNRRACNRRNHASSLQSRDLKHRRGLYARSDVLNRTLSIAVPCCWVPFDIFQSPEEEMGSIPAPHSFSLLDRPGSSILSTRL